MGKYQPHVDTGLYAFSVDSLKYQRHSVNSFHYAHAHPLIGCFKIRLGIGVSSGTLVYGFVAGYVHTTGHVQK